MTADNSKSQYQLAGRLKRVECSDDPIVKSINVQKGKLIQTMTLKSHLFLKEETKYSQGRFECMPEQDEQVQFLES